MPNRRDATVPWTRRLNRRAWLGTTATVLSAASAQATPAGPGGPADLAAPRDLAGPPVVPLAARPARACILLNLLGGPGQLDTWDPKPDAPSEVRGPLDSLATRVPGLRVSELFPRASAWADRLLLIRTLHRHGPALHESGLRAMLTGDDYRADAPRPFVGSLIAAALDSGGDVPGCVVLPAALGTDAGAARNLGLDPAALGPRYAPARVVADPRGERFSSEHAALAGALDLVREPATLRDQYGRSRWGQSCLVARRLVERGVRCVLVNPAETVWDRASWDLHGTGGRLPTTWRDYRETLGPELDASLATLLEDLTARGLWDEVVVAVVSEHGRSPRLNPRSGRHHHTGAWSCVLAGGPLPAGVVGRTDAWGAAPVEQPVAPRQFVGTLLAALGIAPVAADRPPAAAW